MTPEAPTLTPDQIKQIFADVAKDHAMAPKELYSTFYECVLGQKHGPPVGLFTCLVGPDEVCRMIRSGIG